MLNKYLKCSVWRLALRYDIYIYVVRLRKVNNLNCSPNIVRVIKSIIMSWAEHVVRIGEERVPYWVLVGKAEGKRPLGRLRHRCEDNIKVGL